MALEKGWMDDAVVKLNAIADAAKGVKSLASSGASVSNQPQLDPNAVGKALAELLKKNNSLTQSIAVRVNNLSTKYPQRAY